jgi:hypothetical protein
VNILQGLRAVALASGFKRGEFIGDTKLSPIIFRCHHHHRIAHEKIGQPHIKHIIASSKVRKVNKANNLGHKNVVFSLVATAHLQP